MFKSSKSQQVVKPAPAPAPILTGSEKLANVTGLLDKLAADLEKPCMLPHRENEEFTTQSTGLTDAERDAALTQLKLYGTDTKDADPLFTPKGVETITRHALNSPSFTTSRIALRILCNSMLLAPPVRQMFVDLHYEMKLCQRLKNDNREDEFLVSRLIFLTTYGSDIGFENMIDKLGLADIIVHNLSRHAKQYDEVDKIAKKESDKSSNSSVKENKARKWSSSSKDKDKKKQPTEPDPMEDMALVETLKLFFNMTYFCPSRISALTAALPSILRLILKRPANASNPMEPPMGQLLNSLVNLDLEASASDFFPKSDPKIYAERFVTLLDLTTAAYPEKELEKEASPILTVMRKIYAMAPQSLKLHMRLLLLPTAEDRAQPLGQGDTLSSRILRLSTSALCPNARETLSNLLFEMSDKDAKNFVQNVGYGFASGFLFQNNVPIPENSVEAWSTSECSSVQGKQSLEGAQARSSTSSSGKGGGGGGGGLNNMGGMAAGLGGLVNPVTGQLYEKEKLLPNNMTKAEKEREAERLMVLFDRLQKNGVITAEHPMNKMQQEGRFEELSDSDEE